MQVQNKRFNTNLILVLHNIRQNYSRFDIIAEIILAFWLVLANDLLEDRRTIDVIIRKFFPLYCKMAESFENLDDIFRDWAKDQVQKSLVEALKRYEKQEEEWQLKSRLNFLFRKWLRKKKYSSGLSRQSSKTEHKIDL